MAIYERRKSVKELATFSVRVHPDIKAKLEELAYKNRKSLGMTVGEILEAAVKQKQ